MSRTNLSEVNVKFTEEILTSILSKMCNGKKVQLIDWSFNAGSAKGDNYLSNIHKGKVNGIINDDSRQRVEKKIVVKSMPNDPHMRKILRCEEFFHNEITFYTEIAPKFESFLAKKGQSDLLCIPHHITSLTDSESGFIVLEDVSSLGFSSIPRQKCLDWIECTAILRTLAKFHAVSFAYKDQRKEEFIRITDSLKETFFLKRHWYWYKSCHEKMQNIIKHALATESPDSKADKQYNSYELGAIFKKCSELCSRKDAFASVVIEGDCWAPNFLLRNIEHNEKEAFMLDFQLARCASPVLDVTFLIFACTTKSFRDQYFDDALKFYHSELSNVIKLLGSDPKKIYPWDLFMKEIKEQSIFGLFTALEALPIILADVPENFALDNVTKENVITDIGDLITDTHIETASGRQRIVDVIADGVEKGYI